MTAINRTLTVATIAFCFILFVFTPVDVSADWGFRMGDDGYTPTGVHVNISKIEFFIPDMPQNRGISWSGNGLSSFSNVEWSSDKINATYILATGPAITTGSLYWNILFTGDAPQNFRLDYLVYGNDNNLAFGIRLKIKDGELNTNQGSGWTLLNLNNLPDYNRTQAAVPVPPSIFLLGVGLVGIVVLRKKVHK